MPGGLLESERILDQLHFAARRAEERQADGQSEHITRGDRDVRIARDRRRGGAAAGEMIAIDVIGEPGGAVGGRDQRVQRELLITASIPSLLPADSSLVTRSRYLRSLSGPFASALIIRS